MIQHGLLEALDDPRDVSGGQQASGGVVFTVHVSAVGHEAGAAAEATAAVGVHLVHDGGGLLGCDQEPRAATGRTQRHRRRQTQGSPLALRQLARVLPTDSTVPFPCHWSILILTLLPSSWHTFILQILFQSSSVTAIGVLIKPPMTLL